MKRYVACAVLLLLLICCTGCGAGEPTPVPATAVVAALTPTPVPPTSTIMPTPTSIPPTNTPISPTETATPTPTQTETPLPTDTPAPTSPLTGSGGGVIAFTSEIDGDFEIYVANADGSDQRRLTNQPREDYWPTWSPDGTYIAFASERDGNFEIYVMNADGSDQRRLTNNSADDLEPAWSPDGTQIALMVYSAGKSSIYVMDADGSNRRRLAGSSGNDSLPAWSPDGTQIVFVSDRDGNPEIYVMDADGSNQRRLTNNVGDDSYPAWSPAGAPGGAQISFFSARDGRRELYLMDADGSDVRQLTHDDASVWVSAWSPNGTQIAFESDRDGNREIYVMAVAEGTDASDTEQASHLRRLTSNHVLDGIPAWQPSTTHSAATVPPKDASLGDTWTRAADGMTMVYVPGSEFQMGSDDGEVDAALEVCQAYYTTPCQRAWFEVEQPVHTVALDGFWLDRTEVTNAQYRLCVEAGTCRSPRRSDSDTREAYYGDSAFDDYPVVHVTWSQADAYCQWTGGRLPSEAEWEYAARGPEGRRYPWGEEYDGARLNSCDVNCGYEWAEAAFDDGYGDTAPVGRYPDGASWCGALDMAGNVWEWMADWFGEYPAERQWNPAGPSSGAGRALRGDAADGTRAVSRAAARHGMEPQRTYAYTGFRCAVAPHVTATSVPPTAAETQVPAATPTHVEDALQGGEDTGPRRLTENRAADLRPSWEPAPGSGLYLGQIRPGLTAELFAPGIVSIEEGKEYNIAISPDLQEIFFTRRTPGGRDDRLWVSRLENGKLTMPELAPFAYDSFETDACFTPDGKRLYFNSWRPLPGDEAASARPNVWFVDKTEESWSQPQFLGPPLNDYQPVYFSMANDGTLYFTRSSPRGIYYAEPEDGQYREAHRLPDEINYVREVAHPAVAPDESYIIVDSAYEQGGRLVGSLYISFKKPDGSWTKAASLQDALKASESDVFASPRITPDGKYLFFEKYDQATDRADIYWVSANVLGELAPDAPKATTTSDPVATEPASACPTARGVGTVPPAVAICSITFAVNGLEQVVRDGDMLQALPGDEVQVREVTVCAGSFLGNGGEACIDLVPLSQGGQELVSEHAGTHNVRVTPGCTTISGPSHAWTVNENWREIAVVLNHWPPRNTEDSSCGGGRCERDDRVIVRLGHTLSPRFQD